MALNSIEFSAENNQYTGTIDVQTQGTVEQLENAAKLVIARKIYGETGNGDIIFEKDLTEVADLDNLYKDMSVRPNVKYTYMATIYNSSSVVIEFGNTSAEAWIDGIAIGDFDTQYLAPLSCKSDYARNTQVNYVTPLAARTPYRVTNSAMNYTTGQSSGLFLRVDENNNLVKEDNSSYTREVVNFLSNGENKILKTTDGDMWYVSIDGNVSVDFDDYHVGYRIINFDWTEIGDVPLRKQV